MMNSYLTQCNLSIFRASVSKCLTGISTAKLPSAFRQMTGIDLLGIPKTQQPASQPASQF